ncbi:MAG: NAD(P)/FAD-dependent oxidoreductase [Gammaproteobacteria bacterium]
MTISSYERSVETLIVGQGIAGTAVAWELERRGESYLIVDEGQSPTSSLVAAGLITPVTGKRLTIAEHFDELNLSAQTFYKFIEKRLRCHFFFDQPALRLCYSDEEAAQFELRADKLRKSGHVCHAVTAADSAYRPTRHAFLMPNAARLDTQIYLHASRQHFSSEHKQIIARLDIPAMRIDKDRVCFDSSSLTARRVIFCGGYQDQYNPWLPQGVFDCAKGEILRLQIEGFTERRTVHANMSWLCPTADNESYLFGATYAHGEFELNTTEEAKEQLVNRLAGIITYPFSVTGHVFGIRPVGPDRRVIVGRHAAHSSLFWLNGLASKGALHAPYLASQLVDAMLSGDDLDIGLVPAYVGDQAS